MLASSRDPFAASNTILLTGEPELHSEQPFARGPWDWRQRDDQSFEESRVVGQGFDLVEHMEMLAKSTRLGNP